MWLRGLPEAKKNQPAEADQAKINTEIQLVHAVKK